MIKRKIYFRADASPSIGYGHFIRTLALADMLKSNFECTFFTQSPTDYQLEQVAMVCPIVALPSDDNRFDLFLSYLTGDEIVVLDNYFYTTEYEKQIKIKGSKLVCIDDMHNRHYYADVIINQGIISEEQYSKELYTRLCHGFDWLLLRAPFLNNIECPIFNIRKNKVIFSFGGSDMYNLSSKVANILEQEKIQSIGIIGDGFRGNIENYKYVDFKTKISAQEVADLFSCSEYAILPASTMCLEAIACGVKLLMGYYVDNQKEFSDYMGNNGYSYNLGNMTLNCFEDTIIKVLRKITYGGISLPNTKFVGGIKERYVNLFYSL